MGKYVKKPIPVECKQLINEDDCIISIFEWITGEDTSTSEIGRKTTLQTIKDEDGINIETLEGTKHASFGDWVIQDIHGEFYPCKPDIFEESYMEFTPYSPLNNDCILDNVKTKLTDAYEYTFTPEVRNKVSKILHNVANIFE